MFRINTIIVLGVVSLLFSFSLPSSAQGWLWMKTAGGADAERAYSVATDGAGNVYVGGVFEGPFLNLGTATLTNKGGYDIFLAKYDPAGTLLWAKSAGGGANDWAVAVAADSTGNCYIAGYFYSDTLDLGATAVTTQGANDIFLAKYDMNGNVVWAKGIGGAGFEAASCLTTDAAGNVYMAGGYGSTSISFGGYNFTQSGFSSDMFLVKYDAAGNVAWARSASSNHNDVARSLVADAAGNVYLAGAFHGTTLNFGSVSVTNFGQLAGPADAFFAKYDVMGTIAWAKSAGGIYGDEASAVALDASGNLVIAGNFQSPTVDFSTTTLTNTDQANGSEDLFVARFDANGNELWAKGAGGGLNEYAVAVQTDNAGAIYLSGHSESTVLQIDTIALGNAGQYDVFIAKMDAGGHAEWAKSDGGGGDQFLYGSVADAAGDMYLAGSYESAGITMGTLTAANAGDADMFLVKTGNSSTSITLTEYPTNLWLHPNPAVDELKLSIDEPAQADIFDTRGSLTRHIAVLPSQKTIHIADLSPGMYVLRLTAANGQVVVSRFVKR